MNMPLTLTPNGHLYFIYIYLIILIKVTSTQCLKKILFNAAIINSERNLKLDIMFRVHLNVEFIKI